MKRDQVVAWGTLLGVVALMTCGCGGISGSHSVSPASFFLPGLIQHAPIVPDAAEPGAPIEATPVIPETGERLEPVTT